MQEKEYKVVTVGQSGVGKTSLIMRYSTGNFVPNQQPTVGSATVVANINVNDTKVKLNIWDTAGQEQFNSLLPLYFRNSAAVLFVVDISQSVDVANSFYEKVENDIPNNANLYFLCNKSDLVDDDFDTAPFEDFALFHGMVFFKTSAKTGENLNRLFSQIANDCLIHGEQDVQETDYTKEIIGDPGATTTKKNCC